MIVPISLERKIEVVREQLATLRNYKIRRIHIDIIDGLYADNITVSPADLQELDFAGMELDLHLLVDDPVEWIPECVAIKPTRVIAQIEKMGNIEYFLQVMEEQQGVQTYLGVGIHTPLAELGRDVLKRIDGVLLMAIEPGFGGNPFLPEVLGKIRELRTIYQGEIFVDGGIKPATYRQVLEAGASEAGANSYLWQGDFMENYRAFEPRLQA